MHKYITPVTVLLTLGMLSTAPAATTLYDLNDTVLDGSSGENTFIVRNSASNGGLAYNAGTPSLTYTMNSTNSYSYFVAYGDSATLTDVGDSITLSYAFTPSSTSTFRDAQDTLRIGLFNSNGSKMTANSDSAGDSGLNDDRGYFATYSPVQTPSTSYFKQRDSNNSNLWTSASYSTISTTPLLDDPGTGSVTGSFTVTLVETGVELRSVINGGTAQTLVDTSVVATTFDSISLFAIAGTTTPTLTFTDLTMSYSAVPEPSTYAAMLGGALLLFAGIRRKARNVA